MTTQQVFVHTGSTVSVEKLEEYWNKAKALADKVKDRSGEDYFAHLAGIFRNVLAMSTSKAEVKNVEESEWWKSRTAAFKKKYLQERPNSKYHLAVMARRKKMAKERGVKESDITIDELTKTPNADTKVEAPNEPSEVVSPVKQKAEISEKPKAPEDTPSTDTVEEPESTDTEDQDDKPKAKVREKPEFDKHERFRMRKMAIKAWRSKKFKVRGVIRHHKQGFSAIKRFLGGHTLSAVEMERAKRTTSLVAKLVIGAVVGIAMFTPLGGYAHEVGKKFWDHYTGSVTGGHMNPGSESAGDTKDSVAEDFADDMHNWLVHQDIQALIVEMDEDRAKAAEKAGEVDE